MTPRWYRILVAGACDWDDVQALRFALIRAAVPHLPHIVVIHGARPAGADVMTAEWAHDYGVRTEKHLDVSGTVAAGADICLAFITDESADVAECASEAARARIPVQRHLRTGVT